MRPIEHLKATGRLRISLFDEKGALKDRREIDNLVVTAGKNWIAARIDDTPPAGMSHMAVGTGATAPAAGDTTLQTELARVALDAITNTTNTTRYKATFPAGTGTGAITEAGILNAAAAGTLLARTTFAVVNKGAADSMVIEWDVTIN